MSESKVWLITGSSRGLGRALAEAALAAGHRAVATARRPDQLAGLIRQYGDLALAVALDVTDPAAAQAAVAQAVAHFGRLDVVVNNAGYGNVGSVEETPEVDFRAQIEANFFGVVNVTRAALPILRQQGSGRILQISSVGGRHGSPGLGAYQAAKWAVGGFSEVLAKEVAPLGIKITVVEPGGLRTDWAGSSMTIHPISAAYQPTVGAYASFTRLHDGQQMGDPRMAAQILLRLAEEEHPPVRLLVGEDAQFLAAAAAAQRAAEDEKWNPFGAPTTVDGSSGLQALVAGLPASLQPNGPR